MKIIYNKQTSCLKKIYKKIKNLNRSIKNIMNKKIKKIEIDIKALKHCWTRVVFTDGSTYEINFLDMINLVEENTEDFS